MLRFTVSRRRAVAGFTLIEVLVALSVVAVALAAIGSLIATTVRGTRSIDRRRGFEQWILRFGRRPLHGDRYFLRLRSFRHP